jgi:uncharacterized membrane-anchored protein YhcB (DUF1043 family)
MKEVLARFGGNFIVSSFVPALAFVAASMIVFDPIIPPDLIEKMQNALQPFGESGIILLASTIVLGFTLHSLNTFIYKMLEGYRVLARLPWLKKRQIRKCEKLELRLDEVKVEMDEIKERLIDYTNKHDLVKNLLHHTAKELSRDLSDEDGEEIARIENLFRFCVEQIRFLNLKIQESDSRLSELEDERYYIMAERQLYFPLRKEGFLSTRFGNILRAAEAYAGDRYGIDAVRLWPRLVHVIPESYYEKVEQSNNGLAFLVNCAVLSLLFGLLSVLSAIYQCYILSLAKAGKDKWMYFIHIDSEPTVYRERIYIYVAIFIFALFASFIFYRGSFPVVMQYGNMIRSSYDLFRMQLLQALHSELPEDSEHEWDTWRRLSEFVAIGEQLGPLSLEYQISAESLDNS